MTNAYKTAVNEYMIQRGFEDADGNVLKPFRDRVIRRATRFGAKEPKIK